MGSGDLVVHTSGADSREFRFDNVLNIDKKIKDIEALISAKRQVTMAHV
jgi:glycerol-3-phosphate dehydrogenase